MGKYTPDCGGGESCGGGGSFSHSHDKRTASTLSMKCSSQNATSWQPFQKLHFTSEQVIEHEILTKDGKERVFGWSGN